MAYRIDRGTLKKPTKLDNGWLRIEGRLTRTGVFTYRNDDGSLRRELRLPDEVFKADSVQSFALAPVTDEHPPRFLDSKNTKDFARGSVAGTLRRDGEFIAGELLITDAELVEKLERGDAREISCGYHCDLEDAPGVTADGLRYDAVQRNIRGNHVAIVAKGRAGPEARVRMDGALEAIDSETVQPGSGRDTDRAVPTGQRPGAHVKIIRIDGIDYEVGTDAAAQALSKWQAKTDAAIAESDKKVALSLEANEKLQAKLDEALETVKKKDAEIAELPKKLAASMKARAELETQARKVLGSKAKLDADDTKLRAQVIAKVSPDAKLEGKSPAYVEARFDAALESFESAEHEDAEERDTDANDEAREDVENVDGEEDEVRVDAEASYNAMRKSNAAAWQKTLKKHNIEVP